MKSTIGCFTSGHRWMLHRSASSHALAAGLSLTVGFLLLMSILLVIQGCAPDSNLLLPWVLAGVCSLFLAGGIACCVYWDLVDEKSQ